MTATANTQDAGTVECRRCHRALRSEASRAAGIGPRCAAVEAATEGLNAKQIDKMMQVIVDKGVTATDSPDVWLVANEGDGLIRTAHVNGECDCEWGRHRKSADAKVCYHVGIARLYAKPVIRRAAQRLAA